MVLIAKRPQKTRMSNSYCYIAVCVETISVDGRLINECGSLYGMRIVRGIQSTKRSSNYTWRRVQVMKLLIMQFSPTSCHFISLRSSYSSQHPVLICPQSVLHVMSEAMFHTYAKIQAKLYCRIIFKFVYIRGQDESSEMNDSKHDPVFMECILFRLTQRREYIKFNLFY
jgi:hypothetical protein